MIDWFSRYVVAWRLSNTLDGTFCLEVLEEALRGGRRRCSTRTRGCSSPRVEFAAVLLAHGVR